MGAGADAPASVGQPLAAPLRPCLQAGQVEKGTSPGPARTAPLMRTRPIGGAAERIVGELTLQPGYDREGGPVGDQDRVASGAAREVASAAIRPFAPGRFSTRTSWARSADIRSASMRSIAWTMPPAALIEMSRTADWGTPVACSLDREPDPQGQQTRRPRSQPLRASCWALLVRATGEVSRGQARLRKQGVKAVDKDRRLRQGKATVPSHSPRG